MSGTIYLLVIGLSVLLSLINFGLKKNKTRGQGIILGLLILVLVFESIGSYTADLNINNSLLYNICWVYVESLLLVMYFYKFEISKTAKRYIITTSFLLLLWGIANSVFFQSISIVFQFYSFFPISLFILTLCVRFLYNMLNLRIFKDWNLITLPHFWICTGILFFYVEAIFVFGLYQFSPQFVIENVAVIFGFNRLMAGTMYLIFGFSFLIPKVFKSYFDEGNSVVAL
ncbi:hypothetical protein [Aquiflexum gelatinilyticum]|uniref:Uncharacterized protein n=1 Tax=Aquiflexum gelatinilyticum TaxID=2961943 RepID=A0A9X2PDT8_9BACT|nr:hypothetical protein [Aquiflexum gelatinilyticum]MCR9016900.1 hypothetical protein [Aquiflexum gelatinilyticum]MCS4433752.1 hypothetical protein [Aquiflexum gelatinilyticum]